MGLSCAEACACEEGGSERGGEDTQSWGLTSHSSVSSGDEFFWLDVNQVNHEQRAQRREKEKTVRKTQTH